MNSDIKDIITRLGKLDKNELTPQKLKLIVKKMGINNKDLKSIMSLLKGSKHTHVKTKKIPVNSRCACKSGKKYKKCCMNKSKDEISENGSVCKQSTTENCLCGSEEIWDNCCGDVTKA